ncbi:NADPH dehydrogenase [Hypsizygus marmoreus]|uniref:NADPH dehydrogenase n=1 Tax=Hypsizygus marmoreus TaxID=39966 RepID=A0A369K7R8_HYPMA|nr:NADPH dehydrogenase [Hypsizygus marmoreus]
MKGNSGVFSPVTLPCGRHVRNRLVKDAPHPTVQVAMYEHLANFLGGPPNVYHYALYSKWSEADWGMIITGNVQVSNAHLSLGRDVVLPRHITEESLKPFRQWVSSIRGSTSPVAIMQLSHTGRQSTNIIGGRLPFQRPLAPSAVPVKPKNLGWFSDVLHAIMFQTPRPMSLADIDEVVRLFVRGARVALESGFDGVQLHAAHGYLLAQFISPKSNKRTDEYCTEGENALRLLHRVVSSIRATVPQDFILGIKLNAADYIDPDLAKDTYTNQASPVLNHIRTIARWGGIDFIEVSGGDYEMPDFLTQPTTSSPRQALFSRFSHAAVQTLASLPSSPSTPTSPPPLILLTGGLRTPALLSTALASRHAHLLGIGRQSVLCPTLPSVLPSLLASSPSKAFRREPDLDMSAWVWGWVPRIPLVGAGVNMAWYVVMMRRLAMGDGVDSEPDYGVGPVGAVLLMWIWVEWSAWWMRVMGACVVMVGTVMWAWLRV